MRTSLSFTVFAVCFTSVFLQKTSFNLKYGNDSGQTIDVYEPENEASKAILLVHGGAWYAGNKEEVGNYFDMFRKQYPDYLIANMNYRLGNVDAPGYPKQLFDIDNAISFLRSKSGNNLSLALMGVSAGAQLSMLYSYSVDQAKAVKVIVNVVGPADFSAWNYASNATYNELIMNFVGPYYYWQNPGIYFIVSPTSYIKSTSAKTISFYGDNDPWVPSEQGYLLRKRLNQARVINEFYRYPGGHGDWAPQYQQDMENKIEAFLNKHF